VLLESFHRDCRRVGGDAERDHRERIEARRSRMDPVARHPHVLGIGAVVTDAELLPALHGDRVAFAESRVGRRCNLAGNLDAGNAREALDHVAGAAHRPSVLVVDGREPAADDHLTRVEVVDSDLDPAAVASFRSALEAANRLELHLQGTSRLLCRTRARSVRIIRS
jgi:hypothetical protein